MNAQHPLSDDMITAAIARRATSAAKRDLRDRVLAATAATPQRRGWRVRLGGEWLLPQRGLAVKLTIALLLLATMGLVAILVGRPADRMPPASLGALAYLSGGDLYIAGPAGEAPRLLWDLPAMQDDGGWGLAWLDSETLLLNTGADFLVVSELPLGAYVVDVATGKHRMLIAGGYIDLTADRRVVLAQTFDENATPQLSTRLIDIASGATVREIPSTNSMWGSILSPDRRSILGATSESIYTVDVVTGERTELVTGLCCGLSEHMPTWAPDGSRVVYVNYHLPVEHSDCSFRCGTLWSVPTAGGAPTRITPELGSEILPAFSPDGRWIAYIDECPCSDPSNSGLVTDHLTIIATNGSGPRVLAPDPRLPPSIDPSGYWHIPGLESVPSGRFTWDPDSAGITYITKDATLWHVALDGTAAQLEGPVITDFARQVPP